MVTSVEHLHYDLFSKHGILGNQKWIFNGNGHQA